MLHLYFSNVRVELLKESKCSITFFRVHIVHGHGALFVLVQGNLLNVLRRPRKLRKCIEFDLHQVIIISNITTSACTVARDVWMACSIALAFDALGHHPRRSHNAGLRA